MDEVKRPQEPVNARVGALEAPVAQPVAHARSITVLFALSFATLFLLTHPYRGIWHDGILYTAQALRDTHPEHFAHDLFFQFGSQDDWTLYGKLYKQLIGVIGIRAGNLLGLAVAQALWWAGMWRVSKRLLPAPWHWLSLLLIVAMPRDYGDEFVFSYGEFFLSARLPAEALSLWAIAFALERRYVAALATVFVAMAIHPLMGAVGFAATLIIATPRWPWWRLSAAALLAFVVLQFLAPASFLIHPFDSAWLRVARFEQPFLFPTRWELYSWSKAGWVIALPLLLAAIDSTEKRRVWGSFALVGLAGVGVSAIADLGGRDSLWAQLQPWRVLWLLTVVQWIAVAALVRREWHGRRALLWLLVICWLALELAGGGLIALAIAVCAHLARLIRVPESSTGLFRKLTLPYVVCLVVMTLAAAAAGGLFQVLFYRVVAAGWPGTLIVNFPVLEAVIRTRLMALLVIALSIGFLFRDRFPHAAAYLLLVLLAGYAIVNIDQRSPTAKVMETHLDAPARAPFAGRVTPGQVVYWDGPSEQVVYPWLLMKTSSYFSAEQAAGIIFHRQTTFEALRRQAVVDGSRARIDADPVMLFRDPKSFKPLTPDGIIRVCREPELDYVVSTVHDPALSTNDAWVANRQSTYWLYDCRQINAKTMPSLPKSQ